jgi:hypothetical protein
MLRVESGFVNAGSGAVWCRLVPWVLVPCLVPADYALPGNALKKSLQ